MTLPALLVFSAASIADAGESAVPNHARPELTLSAGSSLAFSQPAAGMTPGGSITTPIVVRNTGAGQLRYSLSVTANDLDGKGLGAILLLSIESGGPAAQAASCDMGEGSPIFDGRLAAGGFGGAAMGANPGDRVLDPGAQELLCIRTTLPLSAGNAYQDATTTMIFSLSSQ
ncbi:MAG: hypothetical protein M3067_16470 [Chloroflexota bacterium]|nr:hypothetical protein [Chloroflexota bacterium]